jgi:hypothetical protein
MASEADEIDSLQRDDTKSVDPDKDEDEQGEDESLHTESTLDKKTYSSIVGGCTTILSSSLFNASASSVNSRASFPSSSSPCSSSSLSGSIRHVVATSAHCV